VKILLKSFVKESVVQVSATKHLQNQASAEDATHTSAVTERPKQLTHMSFSCYVLQRDAEGGEGRKREESKQYDVQLWLWRMAGSCAVSFCICLCVTSLLVVAFRSVRSLRFIIALFIFRTLEYM
jgi:hypothetical protein